MSREDRMSRATYRIGRSRASMHSAALERPVHRFEYFFNAASAA